MLSEAKKLTNSNPQKALAGSWNYFIFHFINLVFHICLPYNLNKLDLAQLGSAWLSLAKLGSAWLSLAFLSFYFEWIHGWMESLASVWRVSVQSFLDMLGLCCALYSTWILLFITIGVLYKLVILHIKWL